MSMKNPIGHSTGGRAKEKNERIRAGLMGCKLHKYLYFELKFKKIFFKRSLNFWSQICFIEEAKALKFKFADSFTFKRMVETLRFNNNSSCDDV